MSINVRDVSAKLELLQGNMVLCRKLLSKDALPSERELEWMQKIFEEAQSMLYIVRDIKGAPRPIVDLAHKIRSLLSECTLGMNEETSALAVLAAKVQKYGQRLLADQPLSPERLEKMRKRFAEAEQAIGSAYQRGNPPQGEEVYLNALIENLPQCKKLLAERSLPPARPIRITGNFSQFDIPQDPHPLLKNSCTFCTGVFLREALTGNRIDSAHGIDAIVREGKARYVQMIQNGYNNPENQINVRILLESLQKDGKRLFTWAGRKFDVHFKEGGKCSLKMGNEKWRFQSMDHLVEFLAEFEVPKMQDKNSQLPEVAHLFATELNREGSEDRSYLQGSEQAYAHALHHLEALRSPLGERPPVGAAITAGGGTFGVAFVPKIAGLGEDVLVFDSHGAKNAARTKNAYCFRFPTKEEAARFLYSRLGVCEFVINPVKAALTSAPAPHIIPLA